MYTTIYEGTIKGASTMSAEELLNALNKTDCFFFSFLTPEDIEAEIKEGFLTIEGNSVKMEIEEH